MASQVSIQYAGRLGNQIFQYAAARLWSEERGLPLVTPPPWDAIQHIKVDPVPGLTVEKVYDGPQNFYRERRGDNIDYNHEALFQRSEYYCPHRDRIRSWFRLPPPSPLVGDLVMHCRLTDYWGHLRKTGSVIAHAWYNDIIKTQTFKRLVIVTDDATDPYLKPFSKYSPVIVSTRIHQDLLTLINAERFILSNGTFAWWAAFLGNAKQIWQFDPPDRGVWADLKLPWATYIKGEYATRGQNPPLDSF